MTTNTTACTTGDTMHAVITTDNTDLDATISLMAAYIALRGLN